MTNHEEEVADVVVIGSGPSGGVVTHTLATRGFRVVCLEQGDWVNPTDYPANQPEWELLIQAQWAHDPNARRLPADYPLDVSDSDMWPVMFNAVGGVEHLLRRGVAAASPVGLPGPHAGRRGRRLAHYLCRPGAVQRPD